MMTEIRQKVVQRPPIITLTTHLYMGQRQVGSQIPDLVLLSLQRRVSFAHQTYLMILKQSLIQDPSGNWLK